MGFFIFQLSKEKIYHTPTDLKPGTRSKLIIIFISNNQQKWLLIYSCPRPLRQLPAPSSIAEVTFFRLFGCMCAASIYSIYATLKRWRKDSQPLNTTLTPFAFVVAQDAVI